MAALFEKPEQLVRLYNVLTESSLPPDSPIQITTLENVLYSSWHNDIAFIIDSKLVILVEHQSTVNPNMPLRFLIYIARIYESIIDSKAVYKEKLIKIPEPKFIVLYNGVRHFPDKKVLKLSDAFTDVFKEDPGFIKAEIASLLELEVQVFNINEGHNTEMVQKCEELNGYVQLIGKIRANKKSGLELTDAVTVAVKDCIKEGILGDFLRKYSAEAVNMFTEAFDIDVAKQVWWDEAWEEGMEKGIEKGMEEGMEKGREEALFESAKVMLQENFPHDVIMKITKLSREQLQTLI